MKAISIILGLMCGVILATKAQKADSIVVNYDNQQTTIPVPAFGKQTTIKIADSIQMIEINVSRRGISDISKQTLYPANMGSSQKTKNKAKWFSQVEAGYTLSVPYYYSPTSSFYAYREGGNLQGYKLGLSVREKTRNINNKTAFVTGFKLGYEQSFRNVDVQVTGNSPVYRSSFYQLIFPFAGKRQITAFGLPAYVSYGANFIFGYSFITRKNDFNTESIYDNGLLFLEPFLGIEFNKVGFRIASSRNLAPDMSFYNPVKAVNSISLTYKLR
jgi:hypothetical protein